MNTAAQPPLLRRRRPARQFDHGEPLGRMELGPLAGVLLLAASLVMGFLPAGTHALVLDFPTFSSVPGQCDLAASPCNWHNLAMSAEGEFTWDGHPVTLTAARAMMIAADNTPTGISMSFSPAPAASYEAVLQTLALIGQDLGKGEIVYICGLESARQFESTVVGVGPAECVGAQFKN